MDKEGYGGGVKSISQMKAVVKAVVAKAAVIVSMKSEVFCTLFGITWAVAVGDEGDMLGVEDYGPQVPV